MPILDAPMNTQPIVELFAVLSVDAGGEGIFAMELPGMGNTPLVTSRRDLAELMMPMVEAEARAAGKRVRLVRFTRAETIRQTRTKGEN